MNQRYGFLTNQEIFDKVLTGIRRQGGPSLAPDTLACRHRSAAGKQVLACSIGQLIPDNAYDSSWDRAEISSVDCLLDKENFHMALFEAGVNVDDRGTVDFLINLQRVHDTAALEAGDPNFSVPFFEGFEPHMKELAARYGLCYKQQENTQ